MTTNRLFLSVTLALTVTILVFGFRLISQDKRVMPTLKMSLSLSLSLSEDGLDPANVQTLNDANLIRNLYTRLVEYNMEGELVTAAADSFEISGNRINFRIRDNLKSSLGTPITAADFYMSLKRLLVLDKNTHGDLKNILCGSQTKITMNSPCPGLSYYENNLFITPESAIRIKYVLPLLASVDFSVIPKNAVDWESPQLPIKNYNETSGAFFLTKDFTSQDKTILLQANKNSFYYSDEMPQEIQIQSATKERAAAQFIAKEIDFLPASYSWHSNMQQLTNGTDVVNHETYPIKLWAVRFTSEGIKRTNAVERNFIGHTLKNKFGEIFPDEEAAPSRQMFPKLSEGSLSDEEVASLPNPDLTTKFNRKIKLGIPPGESKKFNRALSSYSWIELVELRQPPWTLIPEKQPDCYMTFSDSSFFEDLSLISNQMSMGTFNLSKTEGADWIQAYLNIEEKPKRLELLKELHLTTLKNFYIVPIGFTNFYSFAQNNWSLNFSKYYVGNPYWQIKWRK